jgi:hypothetical protein
MENESTKRLLKSVNDIKSMINLSSGFWKEKISSYSVNSNSISSEQCEKLSKVSNQVDEKFSIMSNSYLNSTCSNLNETPKNNFLGFEAESYNFSESDRICDEADMLFMNFNSSNNYDLMNNTLPLYEEDPFQNIINHDTKFELESLAANGEQSKRRWKRVEDIKIIEMVEVYGKNWKLMEKKMQGRTAESIKDRFLNKLDPNLKTCKFSQEEDELIIKLHNKYGTRWNEISKFFPNRNAYMIKNRFYSSIRNKIRFPNNSNEELSYMYNNNEGIFISSANHNGNNVAFNDNNQNSLINSDISFQIPMNKMTFQKQNSNTGLLNDQTHILHQGLPNMLKSNANNLFALPQQDECGNVTFDELFKIQNPSFLNDQNENEVSFFNQGISHNQPSLNMFSSKNMPFLTVSDQHRDLKEKYSQLEELFNKIVLLGEAQFKNFKINGNN